MRILFILFVLIPLVEIYLLIQVGSRIGVMATIATVVATAILGAALVRHEGLRTFTALQERLAHQELPGRELADGAMLLLAGALLVTPGFFTDGVGFLLALPWSRAMLRERLLAALLEKSRTSAGHPGSGDGTTGPRVIIEGTFHRHPQDSDPE